MAEWKNLMRAAARDLRIGGRVVFGSGLECALNSDMVVSLVIEEGASGSLQPGSVLCAECSIDLVNDEGQWNAGGACLGWNEMIGATLMPELGVVSGDETLWQPLGVFEVFSAQRPEGEGILRLRARDSIAMELGGLAHEDRIPTEEECDILVDGMEEFCSDFEEIERRLSEKGVVLKSRIMLSPPTVEHAAIINAGDYEIADDKTASDLHIAAIRKKTVTAKVLHRRDD